jgi:uncharacterized membrane protein
VTIEARAAGQRLALVCGTTTTLVAGSLLGALLGYTQKVACSSGGAWNNFVGQFRAECYTDIYPLYYGEGLSSGKVPYLGHPVEYPVLIGWMMQAAAWLVRGVSDVYARGQDFYYVSVAMLAICLVAGVLATAYAAAPTAAHPSAANPGRRWQALMVALSPALIFSAYINWDLLAMALTACGMAAWAAKKPALAGALLGLAVAAKFYPLLIFAALFLVCLRAGQLRAFARCLLAGVLAWLVVNVPIMIAALSGWARFYAFSRSRGADWGSIWYLFQHYDVPLLGTSNLANLNLISGAVFVVAAAAIAALTLAAPRRPRLPQVAFLLLAAFLMSNKVWSPQYVVWLVPLAVLARPRFWPYVLWQLAELAYFFGIWGYFVNMYAAPAGVTSGWYFTTLVARLATVAVLAAYVVSDILHPERDVARPPGTDDPAGGVLDGAGDKFQLTLLRRVTASADLPHPAPPAHPTPESFDLLGS